MVVEEPFESIWYIRQLISKYWGGLWREKNLVLGVVIFRRAINKKCWSCKFLCVVVVFVFFYHLIFSQLPDKRYYYFFLASIFVPLILLLLLFDLLDWLGKSKDQWYRNWLSCVGQWNWFFTLDWGENQMRISCYKFKEKPGLWYEIGVCVSTIKRHCVLLCGLAGRIFPDYITIYWYLGWRWQIFSKMVNALKPMMAILESARGIVSVQSVLTC